MPFVPIQFRDLIFDPKVQEMCVSSSFKCPYYNHSWSCPPRAPYLEKAVSTCNDFYSIYSLFDLESYIKKQKEINPDRSEFYIKSMFLLTKSFELNNLEGEFEKFLSQHAKEYKKRLLLYDGTCRYCALQGAGKCTFDDNLPCRFPKDRRYSMEAVGIEVISSVMNLVKKSKLEIEYPSKKYSYRFGLACFK